MGETYSQATYRRIQIKGHYVQIEQGPNTVPGLFTILPEST